MDKEFFLQELEKQSGMLYRVAFTILHDDYACEDAMQETALKAWEKRNSLREERYFRTWITREPLTIPVGRRRKPTRRTRPVQSTARSWRASARSSTSPVHT